MVGRSSEASRCLLVDTGWSGTACPNGSQALAMLRRNRYQAVLCDLKMPGMDGMEFMGHVREHFPETAFVMVPEPRDLRHGILAMRSGASDYIHTPLRPSTVVASLDRALKRKRLECALVKYRNVIGECS